MLLSQLKLVASEAHQLLVQEKPELAIPKLLASLISVEAHSPNQAKVLRYWLAYCCLQTERYAEALECLEPLNPIPINDFASVLLLVEALALTGRSDAAFSWIEALFEHSLPPPKMLRALVIWAVASERQDLARSYLAQLQEYVDAADDYLYCGAMLLRREGDYGALITHLQNYSSGYQNSRRYFLQLAEAYRLALRHSDALQLLDEAGHQFGFDGNLKKAIIELSNEEPAVTRAQELLSSTPQDERDCLFFFHRGLLHFYQAKWSLAESDLCQSLQLRADTDPETVVLLSEIYRIRSQPTKSLQLLEAACSQSPGDNQLQYALAHDLLLNHRWLSGWKFYESRLCKDDQIFPMGIRPNWSGQSLENQSVLVLAEQGLGDTLMAASQLLKLDHQAREWKFLGFPQLSRLFNNSFADNRFVTELYDTEISSYDIVIGACSLPGYFGFGSDLTSLPQSSYLTINPVDIEDWRQRLSSLSNSQYVFGFTWFGGGNAMSRRRRSLSLSDLVPLFSLPNTAWVSLQYGGEQTQQELNQFCSETGIQLHSYPETCLDLYEQAALCMALDLTISVQQTVVHVAGSVGAPIWTLLPTAPEWRYGASGSVMPWYQSVRLFRQDQPFVWSGVVRQVAASLQRKFDL